MYNWTSKQLIIFTTIESAIQTGIPNFIKIEAVAGSAKSSSLVEAVKRLPTNTSVRYLVFGNANAAEASADFGNRAQVSTLHSLAYQHTVQAYGLKNIRPFLTWKDIPKSIRIPFGRTFEVLDAIDQFCNTTHDTIADYMRAESIDYVLAKPIQKVFDAIVDGKMPCTHSYYLKLFHHELLAGNITLPATDLLLVDEAGDLTAITIDIINNFPAKVKCIVGDSMQNIFGFMNTVNAFDIYRDIGVTLHLSKSFRVSSTIAPKVELFCQNFINPTTVFTGMDYPANPTITTKGILCRSNVDVLRWMVIYQSKGKPFRLSSKAKLSQLFSLPMALLAKPKAKQHNSDLKHIQELIDEWAKSNQTKTKLAYIAANCENDAEILKAIGIITKFGPQVLIEAKTYAETHKNISTGDLICTAHTSKGMTLDHVYIDDSLNDSITKILEDNPKLFVISNGKTVANLPLPRAIAEEFNLYYVSVSRSRYKLDNALHLN